MYSLCSCLLKTTPYYQAQPPSTQIMHLIRCTLLPIPQPGWKMQLLNKWFRVTPPKTKSNETFCPCSLSVTNTFSHCCQLQSLSSCCQPVRWWPYQEPSDKHSLTLQTPIAGRGNPKGEDYKPLYKYNRLKH